MYCGSGLAADGKHLNEGGGRKWRVGPTLIARKDSDQGAVTLSFWANTSTIVLEPHSSKSARSFESRKLRFTAEPGESQPLIRHALGWHNDAYEPLRSDERV